MKVFYKKSYKLIDGKESCAYCPFINSQMCMKSSSWFSCSRQILILNNTQIFDL